MQAMQTCWSTGATVGPFLISVFLVPSTEEGNQTTTGELGPNASILDTTNSPLVQLSDLWFWDATSDSVLVTTSLTITDDIKEDSDVGIVRFGYLTAAAIVLFAPTVFTALFLRNEISCVRACRNNHKGKITKFADESCSNSNRGVNLPPESGPNHSGRPTQCHKQNGETAAETDNGRLRYFRKILVALLLGLAFLFMLMELNTGQLLASYAVRGLGWSSEQGALLTTVYWGSHTAGRALGIFLSAVIPARNLIFVDTGIALSGFAVMMFSHLRYVLTWIAAAMIGLGVSTIFPCLVLVASSHVHVDGRIGGMFVLVTAVGAMLGPWLVSFLMEQYSPSCFTFCGLASAVSFTCCLVCTKLYIRKYSAQ